jgi:hypothetical protein
MFVGPMENESNRKKRIALFRVFLCGFKNEYIYGEYN